MEVMSIQIWAITSPGGITQSGKKALIDEADFPGFVVFSDARIKKIDIPGSEDGALVGYEILTQGHIPINGERFSMEGRIPIRTSELRVSVPSGSLRWFVNHPDRIQVVNQSGTEATFRAENRPAT